MKHIMRKKIIAGNWKMHKTAEEALALASEIKASLIAELKSNTQVVLCVPYPYLIQTQKLLEGNTQLHVAAQDCSMHDWGAYTGEVSAKMLAAMQIPYVVIGHSERRQYHNETNELLARKVDGALQSALTPIYCCGESLEVREKNQHEALVKQQIEEALFHLNESQMKNVVVAYEPVWAIGTGKTASSQQAQDMHEVIRKHIASKYGAEIAGAISILYGGSVKPDNAKELFSCKDVDGGLVGGASLKAADFIAIVESV
jgi:triosephosphate isomerase (TIM)